MKEPYRAVHRYPRNDSGRDFVVGDLHGCFEQLRAELEARHFDLQRDRLFAVGDLVDRGPQSDSVLEAVERYRIKSVKGNHEDVILRWHAGEEQALSLLGNGADWLLDRADEREWVHAIAAYMASLPYLIEIETEHGLVGIVHADSPVSDWNRLVADIERERADGKTRRKAIWSRTRWKAHQPHPSPSRNTLRSLLDKARHSVRGEAHAVGRIENVTAVIVGHTPVSTVTAKDNVINIDTGAVYGGKLTIMDLADLPQWIDVSPRSPVADEPGWREPVMANSAARAQTPELKADTAMAEAATSETDVALADHPAPLEIPAATAARHDDVQNEAPRLAPESRPAPEPLTPFVSNGMHITVRMSLHSMVSEGQQGANTVATRRR
ncbi:metallophosphoesterase [Paraburkholderia caribensis]|uniref:metallophosphoesterase n=1 Tax=Paraburkholderia caribensis TaxID=75105 RepID=UPI00078EB868|nr:metallophosphoesterase [Paraburkholderia caribensis]AMV46023.1 metallophosphoesterase [Paraburkholderia caribensis]